MHVLGIHVDGKSLKMALLEGKGGRIHVEFLKEFPHDSNQIYVKPFDTIAPFLKEKSAVIVSGLDAWEVTIRKLELKILRKSKILKTLPFQVESQIPYPLEQAILSIELFKTAQKSTDVLLAATSTLKLQEHLTQHSVYGIDPDHVHCSPKALHAFTNFVFPAASSRLVFHFG
ncbi:MAG: hypothetical protein ACM3JI_05955, partial [Anaerolineae bacterium]